MQVIEMLWNMLELAPHAAQQAMSAAAAAVSTVPQTQQQIQQIGKQFQVSGSSQEPPWQLSATPAAAADIWVRQSCNASCSNSRPTTSMAPAAPHNAAEAAPVAASNRPDSTPAAADNTDDCDACNGAAGDGQVAAASAATSSCATAEACGCSPVAAQLVEALGRLFKQQLQITSSKQVRLWRFAVNLQLYKLYRTTQCVLVQLLEKQSQPRKNGSTCTSAAGLQQGRKAASIAPEVSTR
jgi:hypothetical protein